MDIRTLTDEFAVSPQLTPEDAGGVAAAGFRSVICNRPDGEEAGQSAFAEVAAALAAEGVEARLVPLASGGSPREALGGFADAVAEMPKPILAYCRSGTRCASLWALSEHGRMDDAEIVERASKAGYDLAALVARMGEG